jgi:hypothetical protein
VVATPTTLPPTEATMAGAATIGKSSTGRQKAYFQFHLLAYPYSYFSVSIATTTTDTMDVATVVAAVATVDTPTLVVSSIHSLLSL